MRSSPLAFALVGFFLSACGPGVHDLDDAAAPILVVQGRVDRTALSRTDPSAPLVAALVWGALPRLPRACFEFDAPDFKKRCPDAYGFFPGTIEQVVPVAADGTATFTLHHLPRAEDSVGDLNGRVAYASVVVAEDLDRNGRLNHRKPPQAEGEPELPDDLPPLPGESPWDADRVVAVSFHTLKADQQRLVFREGAFDEASFFYPAPACAPPPRGFSIERTSAWDAPEGARACSDVGTDDVLEARPIGEEDALAFACRSNTFAGFASARIPPDDESPLPEGAKPVCLSHEMLYVPLEGPCPTFQLFALKGCDGDAFCKNPDWDFTAKPPRWWPC